MCSRYELNANARQVAARFGLRIPPPMPNRAEVRPTDPALVITADGGVLLRWGLAVDWTSQPLINARSDGLGAKATFRRIAANRLLIPATAWWEWRKDGKARIRHRLKPAGLDLFAFAGLFALDPLGGERFTMVTRDACPDAAPVHDRMPAVLAPEAEAAWLAEGRLEPYEGSLEVACEEDGPAQPSLF